MHSVLLFKYNDNSLDVYALLFEYQTFSPLQKRLWWHKYISVLYMQDKACVHATLCEHATFIPTCNLFMSPRGLFMSIYNIIIFICNILVACQHTCSYVIWLYYQLDFLQALVIPPPLLTVPVIFSRNVDSIYLAC